MAAGEGWTNEGERRDRCRRRFTEQGGETMADVLVVLVVLSFATGFWYSGFMFGSGYAQLTGGTAGKKEVDDAD